MNKFLSNLNQTFSDDEKTIIKSKLETILSIDQVKMAWIPTVAANGVITWSLASYSTQAPNPQNIMGPQGEPGEQGEPGADGKDGENGTSITITNIDDSTAGQHTITFSDGKTVTFYDGKDGAGVAIKGTVATKAELPTTAENGDAYIVTGEGGKLFVYAGSWPETGVEFTGPQGAPGNTPNLTFVENADKSGLDIYIDDAAEPAGTILYGTKGEKGDDGYSPDIGITTVGGTSDHPQGGSVLTVTWPTAAGKTDLTASIWNGNNGSNGLPGEPGADGFTPSVSSVAVEGDETHPNGGTKFTFYWPEEASLPEVTAAVWNGDNGAGAAITGNNGISADNGEIGLSGTFAEGKVYGYTSTGWQDATNLLAMYKTNQESKASPVERLEYCYHNTATNASYNFIAVSGGGNTWKQYTLPSAIERTLVFTGDNITGTYAKGQWTLSAKGGETFTGVSANTAYITGNGVSTQLSLSDDVTAALADITGALVLTGEDGIEVTTDGVIRLTATDIVRNDATVVTGADKYGWTTAGWSKINEGGGGNFTGISANTAYFSGIGTDSDPLDLTSAVWTTPYFNENRNAKDQTGDKFYGLWRTSAGDWSARQIPKNITWNPPSNWGGVWGVNGGGWSPVNQAALDEQHILSVTATKSDGSTPDDPIVMSAVDTKEATGVNLPIQRMVAVNNTDQIIQQLETLTEGKFGTVFFVLSGI